MFNWRDSDLLEALSQFSAVEKLNSWSQENQMVKPRGKLSAVLPSISKQKEKVKPVHRRSVSQVCFPVVGTTGNGLFHRYEKRPKIYADAHKGALEHQVEEEIIKLKSTFFRK